MNIGVILTLCLMQSPGHEPPTSVLVIRVLKTHDVHSLTVDQLIAVQTRVEWQLYWDAQYPEYQGQKSADYRKEREAALIAIRKELRSR